MSESENFLRRWSRRKREAAEPAPESHPEREAVTGADPEKVASSEDRAPAAEAVKSDSKDLARADEPSAAVSPALDRVESEVPEFDLSHLPSIESITATTDIRPFLARGVPDSLRRAALRRVWSADPAIRDFIGLAENQWDFTAEDGVPGFGPLLQSDDVQDLVARVFGTARPDSEPAGVELAATNVSENSANERTDSVQKEASGAQQLKDQSEPQHIGEPEGMVPNDDRPSISAHAGTEFAALQNSNVPEQDACEQTGDRPQRRSHGGALPT